MTKSPHIIAISVKLFNCTIVRYANLFPHLPSHNGTLCSETCSGVHVADCSGTNIDIRIWKILGAL